MFALWTEDDELRREHRRLGDQVRVTTADKDRAKMQKRRGSIRAKREKIRRRINRLETPDLVYGAMDRLWSESVSADG